MLQKINLNIENDKVLAYRVDGKVDEEDVRKAIETVTPALETPAHFNMYVEVADIHGITPEAIKERLEFVLPNFKELLMKIDKIALVTDKDWMKTLAKGIYSLIPKIEQKSFSFEESAKARQWVSA